MKWQVTSESDTAAVAAELAPLLKKGDVVLLKGTLGAGKTTFVRALIHHLLGNKIDVPSPTFTLLQTYTTPQFEIFHFDFYRLKTPEEAYEIGFEEALTEGVSLIEWPSKIASLVPKKHKSITFQLLENGDRLITAEGF